MIKIFLSYNNNSEVLQLPVPPGKYSGESPWNNQKIDALNGTLNVIGVRGLRTFIVESYFPIEGHDYPWIQNRSIWGRQYTDIIERWRSTREPIRLVIIDNFGRLDVNVLVTIDEFPTEVRQDGDIYYTLTMTEVKLVVV